jgi:predicted type IV restriction endonuclease
LAASKEIVDLVERFESNLESYESGHYNETLVRREFVDPFFKVLVWDITQNLELKHMEAALAVACVGL